MDFNDIKTWDKFEYFGITWRVYSELVDTNYGPEMRVAVWSPHSRQVVGSMQECAAPKQIASWIIEDLR